MRTDIDLEMKVLRSICDGTPKIRGYTLPLLRELHFSSSATQGLFRRIIRLSATGDTIPTWQDLMHDPGVRKDTRKMMREVKTKPMKTQERIDSSLGTLERLRKVRMLYELGANLEKALDDEEIDPEKVLEQVQKDVSLVGSHSVQTVTTRIGKDANVDDLVKKILTKGGVRRIPTGFITFDAQNVGFPLGGVVILAANTGGGKSAMLNKILHHMANLGAGVAFIPLEMDGEENVTRDLSRVTGQSMTDLLDPTKRISKERRKEMFKQYRRYSRQMAARGGFMEVIEPGFAANIENLLNYVDPLDFEVIAIDYVGLMEGVNGDDQWRALSNAVAYAKRWAGRPGKKRLVIFAAQITEEGYLKQSKAMADHCTNIWRWRVGDEERENGVVPVHQDKCRGGAVFDMPLSFDFAHMDFSDLSKSQLEEWQVAQRDKKSTGKNGWKPNGGKSKSKKKDLHEDDDEDDDDANTVVKMKPRKVKRRDSEY